MSKTFRPRKRDFWIGVCGLAFFSMIGAASIAWCLFEPRFQGAQERFSGAAGFGLFWGFFAALALYEVVAYFRKELTLSQDGVTKKDLFGETALRYADVREVRWGGSGRRRIELRGASSNGRETKLDIPLADLDPRQALDLIRTVRANASRAEHVGWERFCRQYAIPIRDQVNGVKRTLRPDERRLTRGRWSLIFAPSIVVCGLVAVYLAVALDNPAGFAVVAVLAGMWALLHFAWPREGQVVRRRTPEEKKQLGLLGGAFGLFVVMSLIAIPTMQSLFPPPLGERAAGLWVLGAGVALVSVICWAGNRLAETQKERETVESLGAAEEWEEGEQIVFVERGERFL